MVSGKIFDTINEEVTFQQLLLFMPVGMSGPVLRRVPASLGREMAGSISMFPEAQIALEHFQPKRGRFGVG